MHFSRSYDHWLRREIILTVGGKSYTRERCVRELGCANFRAAQNLSRALGDLGITTTRQLQRTTPSDLMRLAGIGERTVFVALCVLETEAGTNTATTWLHADEDASKKRRKEAAVA